MQIQNQKSLSCLLLLLLPAAWPAASASSLGAFVAFNDSVPGLGTGTNVTRFGPGDSGFLRDFITGESLPVSVSVTMVGGQASAVQGRPDYGTPASVLFDGIVDFAGFPNPGLELTGSTNWVVHTFTGLDPAQEYNFQATAIRGNINYAADRWSLIEITNAAGFVSRHSAGAFTHSQVSALKPSQVVIATGNNVEGVLAWWEHIRPGTNGSFTVLSRQYTGALPGGGKANGAHGYGLTGFRLEQGAVYSGRTNPPPRTPGHSEGGINGIGAVWLVVMENHDWSAIKGNTNFCAYINNALLPNGAWCERYYNPPSIHPSLPNYLWLVSGTNFGIRDDSTPSVNHRNTTNTLIHLLDAAGISWKCYAEDITGTNCPDTNVGQYVARHVPFVYFDSVRNNLDYCTNHIRPFAELDDDLASGNVARFNFLVPNKTNDMHDLAPGSPSTRLQGDNWLARELPAVLGSAAYTNGGLVLIVFDEGEDSTGDGPIGAILLSPRLRQTNYGSTVFHDHSSLVRTLQDIFGVQPYLGGAAWANDMGELFRTLTITGIQREDMRVQVAVTNLVAGHTYRLQYAPDPAAGPWLDVSTNIAVDDFTIFLDSRPALPPGGFYRVRE